MALCILGWHPTVALCILRQLGVMGPPRQGLPLLHILPPTRLRNTESTLKLGNGSLLSNPLDLSTPCLYFPHLDKDSTTLRRAIEVVNFYLLFWVAILIGPIGQAVR